MTKRAAANKLPVRNTILEALIYAGGVGLVGYAIGIIVLIFIANAFYDSDSSAVGLLSLIALTVVGLLVAQALLLVRQWQRVDRYYQRLTALGLMRVFPLLLATNMVLGSMIARGAWDNGNGQSLDDGWLQAAINVISSWQIFSIAAIASTAGMIWLWTLLLKKDKLLWELEGDTRTKDYKQRHARLFRNKRIGSCFVVAPIALLVLYIFIAFAAGSYRGNAVLYNLANTTRELLLFGWLPSVLLGIVVLARNK